jgi:flagellar protein FlaG
MRDERAGGNQGRWAMEAIGALRATESRGTEAVIGLKTVTPTPSRKTKPKTEPAVSENSSANKREVEKDTRAKIERVAQAMEDYVKSNQRSLRIQVHPGTGDFMVKVISEEDGRVIREVPPEELLNLAAKMEAMIGVLFNDKV